MSQLQGALYGAPLLTMESALIVRPQLSALVAAMILLFTLAYVAFQASGGARLVSSRMLLPFDASL